MTTRPTIAAAEQVRSPWQDTSRSIEERVDLRTAFTGRDLRRVVEPGNIEVLIGTSAVDLPCRGEVQLTGPVRVVGRERRLVTPVEIRRAAYSVPA